MLKFILMVNKQGQTRLAEYCEFMSIDERVALEAEIIRKCLSRTEMQVRKMWQAGVVTFPRLPALSLAVTRARARALLWLRACADHRHVVTRASWVRRYSTSPSRAVWGSPPGVSLCSGCRVCAHARACVAVPPPPCPSVTTRVWPERTLSLRVCDGGHGCEGWGVASGRFTGSGPHGRAYFFLAVAPARHAFTVVCRPPRAVFVHGVPGYEGGVPAVCVAVLHRGRGSGRRGGCDGGLSRRVAAWWRDPLLLLLLLLLAWHLAIASWCLIR